MMYLDNIIILKYISGENDSLSEKKEMEIQLENSGMDKMEMF